MAFFKKHPFHIVTLSPWPFFLAMGAFSLTMGFVLYMHSYLYGVFGIFAGFSLVLLTLFNWWSDVIVESTFEGEHTTKVETTYMTGFFLFILSELMFFVTFFWSNFHYSFNPNIFIGAAWPPIQILPKLIHHSNMPALMNQILICSSLTASIAHFSMNINHKSRCAIFLSLTICLGLFFSIIQYLEYTSSALSFSDGIFGSLLYLLTGFHGTHVIIGNLFLIVCLVRLFRSHFTKEHHIGFLTAVYYWHFVDFIWLCVYYLQYVSTFLPLHVLYQRALQILLVLS